MELVRRFGGRCVCLMANVVYRYVSWDYIVKDGRCVVVFVEETGYGGIVRREDECLVEGSVIGCGI